MKTYPYGRKTCCNNIQCLGLLSLTLISSSLVAQNDNSEEEVFELSPFTVQPASGYTAQSTLSGSRLNTELKNVSQSVSILTEDFLADMDVLNPEDAMLYSLNVENRAEFSDAVSSSGNFNEGIAFNNFSGRVRGIDSAGRMRDFFNTNLESDSYALGGGVSVSSGPNAVIFGIGGTGGVISTGYKKAIVGRDAYALTFRTDSEGSFRVVADMNKVLLEDKLAIRIIGLNDEFETYRHGSDGDQERYFYSLTAHPWKGGSFTGYYEDVDIHKALPRNMVAYDGGVTAYMDFVEANGLEGDARYYDNRTNLSGTSPWASVVERNNGNRWYWYNAPDGTQEFVGRTYGPNGYTVQTIDPSTRDPNPLDRYRWSLPEDSPLVSKELNIHGDTTNRRMTGSVYGAIFTQQITDNLHIELGYNKEEGMTHFTSMASPGNAVVRVDTNLYKADKVTLNPNRGMYYVEDWGQSSSDFNALESFRATVSYDLDLSEKKLGHHKIMGLYTDDQIDRFWSWMRTKQIPADQVASFASNYTSNGGLNDNTSQFRWYLNDDFEMINPWDGFEGGEQADGSFVWARGNVPSSGLTWSQLKKERGATLAAQSFWLDDRLVTTLGYRKGWFQDGEADVKIYGGNLNTNGIPRTSEIKYGYQNIEDVDRSLDYYYPEYSANAINYGAVYHITDSDNKLGQFSLVYNFADIFTSPTPNYYPDGVKHGSPTGESYDIGVMWQAPNGKLGGKLTYYNTEAQSLRSTEWQNSFKNPMQNLERQIGTMINGLPADNADDTNYAQLIADGLIVDANTLVPITIADIPSVGFDTQGFDVSGNTSYGMTADREATGYEFEGWANPTDNITLRLTAAKGEATDYNVAKGYDTWIEKRIAYWTAWADWETEHRNLGATRVLSEENNSVADYFASIAPGYSTLKSIPEGEGTRVSQNVGLRVNLTAKYSFKEGALKGFEVGGSYRFREAAVIGYIAEDADDAFAGFPYPSDASGAAFTATDVNQPVFGTDTKDVDMFFNYGSKFGNGVRYDIRFNVRNVFDSDGVVPQRADSSGNTVIYAFKAPRTYSLSLGLRF